jgi:hypothetical protein
MKVYALISNYDDTIEGIYTLEGKKARHKQLLEEAQIGRIRHIEELEKIKSECSGKAVYFYNEAVNLLCTENALPKISELLDKCKFWEAERNTTYKTIESINQMPADEVLKRYGCQYYWEEHELVGD